MSRLADYHNRLCSSVEFSYLQVNKQQHKIYSGIYEAMDADKQIGIYVQLTKEVSRHIKINTKMKVAELIQIVKKLLLEQKITKKCAYLQYQQKILYHQATISNYQILNESLIKIIQSIDIHIKLQIKIYGYEDIITNIQVTNTTKIQQIKNRLANEFQLNQKYIQLYYGIQELKGYYSLADFGISNNQLLSFRYNKLSGFVCQYINRQSFVQINQKQGNRLAQLASSSNKQLLTYNSHSNITYLQDIVAVKPKYQNKFTQIQLQNGKIVNCTDDMEFYTGQAWKSCSQQLKMGQKLQIGDSVFLSNKKLNKVKNIYHRDEDMPLQVMDVQIENNQPIFINDIFVRKTFFVTVLYKKKDKFFITSFSLAKQKDILYLKKQIQQQWNIKIQDQLLYFKHKLLKNETILSKIWDKNAIIILYTQKMEIENKIQKEKMINIKFQHQIKTLSYGKYCKIGISKIIEELFPLKLKYNKIYGLLYNRQPIPNHLCFQDIIKVDEKFYYEDHTIIVVRCLQKFIIKQLLMVKDQVKSQEKLFQTFWRWLSRQNNQDSLMSQYRRIMRESKHQMVRFLQQLRQLNLKNILNNQFFKFFIQFIAIFKKTTFNKHYHAKCYKLLPNKIPPFYKENDVLISRDFMSCTTNNNEMLSVYKDQNKPYTFVTISSLTGKIMESQANEIVFLPFTYFMIHKIQITQNGTEIKLLEMPSPICFDRNIIVWVDDNPKNNINYLNSHPNLAKIQVLQLISTQMALVWFNEFSSLVNGEGIEMKVISDLVRKQMNLMNDKYEMRYEAGVDLAEQLFNKKGLTTPIFIFSKQMTKGLQLIQRRQISKNRICKISNKLNQLIKYSTFN